MKKHCAVYLWFCTACSSKHYGKNPPFSCHKCGVESNRFILLPQREQTDGAHNGEQLIEKEKYAFPALDNVLYLIGSYVDGKANAMCCSSVAQISYCPARISVAINKNNLTHDFIKESGYFSVCLLGRSQGDMAHFFGRNSGRQINKFDKYNYFQSSAGSPIVANCPGYYICKVNHGLSIEVDSHSVFVGDIIEAELKTSEPSLTYYEYQVLANEGTGVGKGNIN